MPRDPADKGHDLGDGRKQISVVLNADLVRDIDKIDTLEYRRNRSGTVEWLLRRAVMMYEAGDFRK